MIEEPLIIVGCGRSGTTLVYHLLCCHEDVAWFSNLTDRSPARPYLASASNLFRLAKRFHIDSSLVPVPSEGYRFWNLVAGADGLTGAAPLNEQHASGAAKIVLEEFIAQHLRFQRKDRFVNKNTRNTRRLRYVRALLPSAKIINVIRDPRATVASLLRVAFWPTIRVWSQNNIGPTEWMRLGRDPAELAAHLWAADVARSLEDAAALPSDCYRQIHYERVLRDPEGTIKDLSEFADLRWSTSFGQLVRSFKVRDSNNKYRSELTDSQLSIIGSITGKLAHRLGYQDV